jgi:hypothetical protein
MGTMPGIQSALAIYAVETAHFSIAWQQIDAKRDAQTAAMYRPEDGRRIDNRTHKTMQSYVILF